MTLWQLYILFASTAAFTFGGGYAMIPLLSNALVPEVLTSHDMGNIIALAQMTPGAVGLNTATYVGFREYSLLGAIICTAGLTSPGVVIATFAAIFKQAVQNSFIYKACLKGIRPLVIGLIASVIIFFAEGSILTAPLKSLWTGNAQNLSIDIRSLIIFATTIFLEVKFKLSVLWLILIAGALGALLYLF